MKLPIKPLRAVALIVATGLGVGYLPLAPGTYGTVVGLFLFWGMSDLPLWMYSAILCLLIAMGTWAAAVTGKIYGEVDSQRIVIDEVAGYLITMILSLPNPSLTWMLIGFVLFRFFDIVKPFPVDWADSKVKNAFGVMLDDILAGGYALGVLALLQALVQTWSATS
jgi:phosphatidylglycerophosphatase A